VLAPPVFEPPGGDFKQPIQLTLRENQSGAVICYTLDGTVPTRSSPRYDRSLTIAAPVTVRAKAFKSGFTSSVTSQETYIIGE
jgi:chitinase